MVGPKGRGEGKSQGEGAGFWSLGEGVARNPRGGGTLNKENPRGGGKRGEKGGIFAKLAKKGKNCPQVAKKSSFSSNLSKSKLFLSENRKNTD